MNKAGIVLFTVSVAVLVALTACADLDKLDGTRDMSWQAPPGNSDAGATSSEDASAIYAKLSAGAGEARATDGASTGVRPK